MKNRELIVKDLWNNKVIVLFHLINRKEVNNVLNNGFSRTEHYPYILYQNEFMSVYDFANNDISVAIVAIPDEVYMKVCEIKEWLYDEWKSQFDYYSVEDSLLDEVNCFCNWNRGADYIENFIPSSLVYGVISLNENGEPNFYKNENFYDSLDKSQKKVLCELLNKAYYKQEIPHSKYNSLVKKIR